MNTVPAHFYEICYVVASLLIGIFIFQDFVLKKTLTLSPKYCYRTKNDSEIVFVPEGNKIYKKSEIRRNDKLFAIPVVQNFEFNDFNSIVVSQVKFKGSISIRPKNNSAFVKYFELIIKDKTKKTEISFKEMSLMVSKSLDKAIHFGSKDSFVKFLKHEIVGNTCFHAKDVLIENFEIVSLN